MDSVYYRNKLNIHAIIILFGGNLKSNDVLQAVRCSPLTDALRNDPRSPLNLEWK